MENLLYIRVLCVLMLLLSFSRQHVLAQGHELNTHTRQTLYVKHYQVQKRYEYGASLLALALSKLDVPFVVDAPASQMMNEARGEREVIAGRMDVQWMSTTVDREETMLPIRIPLYRGVLGLRLLLAKKDKADKLRSIHSINELGQFVGGHGLHWGDLPVYKANNLKVVTHVKYSHLFEMLRFGRFDYFHRGVNEIWDEHAQHQEDLDIVDEVMLFYPHPVYFFVSKQRPELAAQLEKGLRLALEDGSFKKLFLTQLGAFIDKGELAQRRLIPLANPVLPLNSPSIDTSWWLPEKFSSQLQN